MDSILNLPELSSGYAVGQDQHEEFQKNGHILLREILNKDEIKTYRDVIVNAAEKYNTENRKMEERDTYGKAFLQIMNLWEVDEQVRKFTLAKRFAKIAASLMGVEKVRIYHDQALFKEAGGGLTPWHQDQYYWPLDTDNTITMWMPLVDISVEMGMLTFATGSQEVGFLGNLAISDESEGMIGQLVEEKGYPITRASTMNAGDATWHAGWTLHAAPGNSSDKMREVMTIIYVADGAKITEPKNQHQENDRKRWLAGMEPGQFVDSVLNPVV
ncbi:Ectoine hydroxylase-related dioxygenase, phytanoyl-CoA dioxygenase (PhyH) family [Pseudarcicella hirudinis]|uniref:Ectoine hydroxylase-related dioxygenase, phytanoyl-CoA dioxygenase (PhyH) family n=1 Tax=Pseudarcicella hirudinis TaxID=1079859 RepID=A0A1I5QNM5_9BACT|nr:phytanoyl-CoA dioxygenase family protein [Pseudarcicella hirudinis]SFP47864.1 Ectoine hydroxylase-related dioxygenase, phytanoyl-CoA dioxygenase (PhyH) family [Pseudarcicella hirudinis]